MKSGTQLLNFRSSGAKLKIAIFQENDAVSRNTIHHLRHFVSRPETDSTGNGPKLFWSRLLPTIPTLLFRGHEVHCRIDAPLFLLKETEMNVPHDREARMHEQKPFSVFIKSREGHEKKREEWITKREKRKKGVTRKNTERKATEPRITQDRGQRQERANKKARKLERTEKPSNTQTDREEKQKPCPVHAITIVFDFVSPHQVSSFSFPAFRNIIIHLVLKLWIIIHFISHLFL